MIPLPKPFRQTGLSSAPPVMELITAEQPERTRGKAAPAPHFNMESILPLQTSSPTAPLLQTTTPLSAEGQENAFPRGSSPALHTSTNGRRLRVWECDSGSSVTAQFPEEQRRVVRRTSGMELKPQGGFGWLPSSLFFPPDGSLGWRLTGLSRGDISPRRRR